MWSLEEDGVLTISGIGEMYDSPQFQNYSSQIRKVFIEPGATSIGGNAFYYCQNLTDVEIPESVTSIGRYAFYMCKRLTHVAIPSGVTEIGDRAFGICSSLFEAEIPKGVTAIGAGLFQNCSRLVRVTIPSTVTAIHDYAFIGCYNLADVFFTGSEEQWNAVEKGNGNDLLLEAVIHFNHDPASDDYGSVLTLPLNLTSIESEAFAGINAAQAVRIPETVTEIADDAFDGSSVVILAPEGSYAIQWAQDNNIPYHVE